MMRRWAWAYNSFKLGCLSPWSYLYLFLLILTIISRLMYHEYLQHQQDDMMNIISKLESVTPMNSTNTHHHQHRHFSSSLLPEHFIKFVRDYLSQNFHQYLIVSCRTGVGNRLQTIISAFLMGMLMRRRLIIDWSPTSLSSCQYHELFDLHSALSMKNLFDLYTKEHILTHATLLHFHGPIDELLCHDNLSRFHQQTQFVFLMTDEYFMSVLMKNPAYSQTLFHQVSEDVLFQSFLNYLFVPIKKIRETIHNQTQQMGRCDRGLQLRKNGLKQIQTSGEEYFLKCALNQSSERNETWFVVSDHPPYKNYVKFNVPSNRIQVWILDTPTNPNLCSNVQQAVVEMWILSECHEILMTQWSSFGWLAASRAGIHPTIVSTTSCHIQQFSHPCYYELRHLKQLSCFNDQTMLKDDGCCESEGFCGNQCLHHNDKYRQVEFLFLMLWPFESLAKWFLKWSITLIGVIFFMNRCTGKCSWIFSPHLRKLASIVVLSLLIIFVNIRCLLWSFIKFI